MCREGTRVANLQAALKTILPVLFIGMFLGAGLALKFGSSSTPETIVTEKVKTDVTDVKNNDIKTVIIEKINKDGSKEITKTIVDNSVEKVDKSTETSLKSVTVIPKNWHASVGYLRSYEHLTDSAAYQLTIERKVFGPFSLGVTGSTNKQIGLTLGFEF